METTLTPSEGMLIAFRTLHSIRSAPLGMNHGIARTKIACAYSSRIQGWNK